SRVQPGREPERPVRRDRPALAPDLAIVVFALLWGNLERMTKTPEVKRTGHRELVIARQALCRPLRLPRFIEQTRCVLAALQCLKLCALQRHGCQAHSLIHLLPPDPTRLVVIRTVVNEG